MPAVLRNPSSESGPRARAPSSTSRYSWTRIAPFEATDERIGNLNSQVTPSGSGHYVPGWPALAATAGCRRSVVERQPARRLGCLWNLGPDQRTWGQAGWATTPPAGTTQLVPGARSDRARNVVSTTRNSVRHSSGVTSQRR